MTNTFFLVQEAPIGSCSVTKEMIKKISWSWRHLPACLRRASLWPSCLSVPRPLQEEVMATASLKGDDRMGIFCFSSLGGKNYWVTLFLKGKFLFKFFLGVWDGWMGKEGGGQSTTFKRMT